MLAQVKQKKHCNILISLLSANQRQLCITSKTEGVAAALAKYSQITDEQDVALIKRFYDMLSAKAPFAELIAALNEYAE